MNKQLLLGNLVKDPEKKNSKTNVVAQAHIATNDAKRTDYHNLKFFGKTAEFILEHARKGSKLFIEGKTVHNSFEGRDGNMKYMSEVIVQNAQLLSGWAGDSPKATTEDSKSVEQEEPPF